MSDKMDIMIKDLPISGRAYNAMHRGGIRTVGDLVNDWDAWELSDLRGFGRQCMAETVNALAELGLPLKHAENFRQR